MTHAVAPGASKSDLVRRTATHIILHELHQRCPYARDEASRTELVGVRTAWPHVNIAGEDASRTELVEVRTA